MSELTAAEVWEKACKLLSDRLSKDVFDRWISVIDVGEIKNGTLHLTVANDFYQSWLQDHYASLILEALQASCDQVQHMVIGLGAQQDPMPRSISPEKMEEHNITQGKPSKNEGTLNPHYVFDTFVVGSSNNFSHAAAMAVAQSPGRAYNPLFIHGGVGLGKSHLLQAIGHHISEHSKQRVCYTTCETFVNEYIDALDKKKGSVQQFRRKFRGIDVLLIDDIHFLANKEAMQEEFFHTFNDLHVKHKQIVITSDRPASELKALEQRLVSRFEWGMVTELETPDVETRVAILRKKQRQMKCTLSDDTLFYIAENIRSNIRRLEGALIRVSSYASLTGKVLTRDTIEYLLRDSMDQEKTESLTIEAIQRVVAEYYDIRLGDMTSKQRPQSIAFPRQVAMYLCRTMTDSSSPCIGDSFGRNHATVLHACKLIEERSKGDTAFRQSLLTLRQKLGQRSRITCEQNA